MSRNLLARCAVFTTLILALWSCGGGGDGGGAVVTVGAPGVYLTAGTSPADAGRSGATYADTGGAGGAGGAGGTGSEGGPGGTDGTGAATSAGSGSGSDDGSTSTASGGDDAGVGSGGTGVSTADASVGSVDGFGSIIVNGLRYNTDAATFRIEDAAALQIGMTLKVTGPIDADFLAGVARLVESAADLRGPVSAIDNGAGSFVVQGTTVSVDSATVWADSSGLAGIAAGTTLQVWGLPSAPGTLRATRVEQRPAVSAPIVTGTVQSHDLQRRSFVLGSLTIDYGAALLAGTVDAAAIADGSIVRVRSTAAPFGRTLVASAVQRWNPIPLADGSRLQIAGVATDFASLAAFRLLNVPVDGSGASITGGNAVNIGNGVKLEIDGVVSGGKLVASKIRIRHVPGTGGTASFDVSGAIGSFTSPASFRVRGQPIDASGAAFVGGSVSGLGNGVRVRVIGSRIVDGVLIADQVSFQ